MKTINVVNGPQNVSAIVQGCMRMAPLSIDEATKVRLILLHPGWCVAYSQYLVDDRALDPKIGRAHV